MQGDVLVQLIGGGGGGAMVGGDGVAGTERAGRRAWGSEEGEEEEEGGVAPLVVAVGGGGGGGGGSNSRGNSGGRKEKGQGGKGSGAARGRAVKAGQKQRQPSLLARWRSGWGRAWAKKPPAGGAGGGGGHPAGAEDCSSCPPPLFILAVSIVEVTLYLWVGASDASVEGLTLSGFPPPAPSLAPPASLPPGPVAGHHQGPLVAATSPGPPYLQHPHPQQPLPEDHRPQHQHHMPETPSSQLRRFLLFDPHRRWEAWRFATYMLLHTGALHLALNVAIQVVLATPLEAEQGHLRTGLVYIGGGLGGSLSTSMLEPEIYIVGASGGVYALLISQLANVLLNFRRLRYKAYRAVAVAVISLADVAFSVYHFVRRGNECPRIGWAAHTGGALAGLLLGLVLFRSDEGSGNGGGRGRLTMASYLPGEETGREHGETSRRHRGRRRRPLAEALLRWLRALGPHQAARWAATLVLCAFVTAAVVSNVLHPETTQPIAEFAPSPMPKNPD